MGVVAPTDISSLVHVESPYRMILRTNSSWGGDEPKSRLAQQWRLWAYLKPSPT